MKGGIYSKMQLSKIKNKRGAYGIEVATSVIMSLFLLVLVVVAVLVGISTLRTSNLLPASSAEKNATDVLMGNLTEATGTFAKNFSTFMSIIAIVIIMTFIGLMIYVVRRFTATKGEKGI